MEASGEQFSQPNKKNYAHIYRYDEVKIAVRTRISALKHNQTPYRAQHYINETQTNVPTNSKKEQAKIENFMVNESWGNVQHVLCAVKSSRGQRRDQSHCSRRQNEDITSENLDWGKKQRQLMTPRSLIARRTQIGSHCT